MLELTQLLVTMTAKLCMMLSSSNGRRLFSKLAKQTKIALTAEILEQLKLVKKKEERPLVSIAKTLMLEKCLKMLMMLKKQRPRVLLLLLGWIRISQKKERMELLVLPRNVVPPNAVEPQLQNLTLLVLLLVNSRMYVSTRPHLNLPMDLEDNTAINAVPRPFLPQQLPLLLLPSLCE
jgi:hypothetical protein